MDIAVLGATGEVGRTILQLLEEREFPVDRLYPLASSRSAGGTLAFKSAEIEVLDAEKFDFSKVELAFFSAGGEVSARYVPAALEQSVTVIDNTSHYRMQPEVPLVVPEVNGDLLDQCALPQVISCPNCSTIQMVVALSPLAKAFGLSKVEVVTFQAVSGAGQSAMTELSTQTASLMSGQEAEAEVFSSPIAFNVLPAIGSFDQNRYTQEENKMILETRKILQLPNLSVNPTCVRVPVFYGHSEAVCVALEQAVTLEQFRTALVKAEGLELMDDPRYFIYPTPMEHAAGQDVVLVGRIRPANYSPDSLSGTALKTQPSSAYNMWVVADNVRKGAALNSIQIAERLLPRFIA
ncbi:MAG: aspartate-semialdehyde dehydrogenase [Gammaproteobacteria bacterium]